MADSSETVTLTIDGVKATVRKGTNLLEACRSNGVDISYFCYHPGLSSPAVCRQCLVEVVGQPKLVPSCYTPVVDNMQVVTASDRVKTARQQMLEFTLVNHPVDCPICDKAGECTLQKLYMEWDGRPSRTEFDKVHKPKAVDLGPTIVLDQERCILCTRCIRVCNEVAHNPQLGMAFRGDHEVLTVAPGEQLDNPYSLNTVDVCPVGALTAKDFRFQMRAWELFTTDSICSGCATGCNIEIHHAQGQAWRLVPRPNPEVNRYWMCDEGRLTYHELTAHRVQGAELSGDPVPIEKAIHFAADRIGSARQQGRLGIVFGAQCTNEDLFLLGKVALDGLGGRAFVAGRSPNPGRADAVLRAADRNPNRAGAHLFSRHAPGVAELEQALAAGEFQALWIVGEDLVLSEWAQAALATIDTIVQAVHSNEITARARVVLPAAAWAEVDGTFINSPTSQGVTGGRVQRIRQAFEPPGAARPHWDLIARMARALGQVCDVPYPRALFEELKPQTVGADWGRPQPLVQLRFANSRG